MVFDFKNENGDIFKGTLKKFLKYLEKYYFIVLAKTIYTYEDTDKIKTFNISYITKSGEYYSDSWEIIKNKDQG